MSRRCCETWVFCRTPRSHKGGETRDIPFPHNSGGCGLLLEQIFEGRPRIVRPQAGGSGSFFLPGHAHFVERAFIAGIFLRDPLLHRLHALKPAARIEIRALLAGMQFKAALRAFLPAGHPLQHCSALRTARYRARPRQVYRARTERMIPPRRTALTFCGRLARFLLARLTIIVLISRLTIFRHSTLPSTRPYSVPCSPGRQA